MKNRILAAAVAIHALACLCAFVAVSGASAPDSCRPDSGRLTQLRFRGLQAQARGETTSASVTQKRPTVKCEVAESAQEAITL